MTAFSKTTRLAFAILCIGVLALPAAAQENRTAGTMPVSVPQKKEKTAAQETAGEPGDSGETEIHPPAAPPPVAPAAPPSRRANSAPVDFDALESYGLLTNLSDGGMGIDVWEGSDKGFLLQLLESMNASARYPAVQDLLRRTLLTRNDPSLMAKDTPSRDGRDFLTLRIEKLTQMGMSADAAKLYTENPQRPYHERLARAGVTALMLDGQMPLACLEALALEKDFPQDDVFWQQAEKICGYFMGKAGDSPDSPEKAEGDPARASKIIAQVIRKKNFRYVVNGPEDFESLSYLEKAVLICDRRMDYSRLKESEMEGFPPLSAVLFLKDENLPESLRFKLLSGLVEKGHQPPESLAALYESVSFPSGKKDSGWVDGYNKTNGWKRLAFLFQAARANGEKDSSEIIDKALILNKEYGIYALAPFATFLDGSDPAGFSPESVRTGIKLYAFGKRKAPAAWRDRWALIKTQNMPDLLLDAAYKLAVNEPLEKEKNTDDTSASEPTPQEGQTALLAIIEEKLDKTQKFHKDTASDVYEKNLDLTLGSGYVMPVVSLIDNLEKAAEDRRLGEVVLLSSIALNEVPPEKKNTGILRKVMYGLETVGLTKEARELAMEAALGSDREKEN